MARRKVPSQAASGAETFNDNLVGLQITDGTSQLFNTNFTLDKVIAEKDSKNFSAQPFSDFLTLDDLQEQIINSVENSRTTNNDIVKFKGAKNNANKSLFGSLKKRILVSVNNIIKNYPASLYVNSDNPISLGINTAFNITYDSNFNTTSFDVEVAKIFNPFDIVINEPQFNLGNSDNNNLRNFYSAYKNYVVEISGETYNIINYTNPNSDNVINLKLSGKPFITTGYTENFLIRPNNGLVEEY